MRRSTLFGFLTALVLALVCADSRAAESAATTFSPVIVQSMAAQLSRLVEFKNPSASLVALALRQSGQLDAHRGASAILISRAIGNEKTFEKVQADLGRSQDMQAQAVASNLRTLRDGLYQRGGKNATQAALHHTMGGFEREFLHAHSVQSIDQLADAAFDGRALGVGGQAPAVVAPAASHKDLPQDWKLKPSAPQ
jgi:hypothetical protein